MAFVVADGTGLATSTSYVDLAFASAYADSYFTSAQYTTWTNVTEADLERSLNRASMYLDTTYVFKGRKLLSTQALQFPRSLVYDIDGALISGIPTVIKQAACLAAVRMLGGINLSPDVSRGGIIREKVDTIDITYAEGSSRYTRYTDIDNLLKASNLITQNRNSSANIRIIQG